MIPLHVAVKVVKAVKGREGTKKSFYFLFTLDLIEVLFVQKEDIYS